MNSTSKLLTIGTILIVALLGYLVYHNYFPNQLTPANKIEKGINPPLGNPDAKVIIVEFSDFQCPACKGAEPVIKDILSQYGDKIVIYYRNFPLTIHQYSFISAQAAEAANEQGKFWEYHDILFANQQNLDKTSLQKYASQIGLNMTEFDNTFDSGKYDSQIQKDISDAKSLGIKGTPTFYVNGKEVFGVNEPLIKQYIDEELK